MRSEQISPFVYWAQDKSNLFIKIDLKDIKDDKVLNITDDTISLDAFGVGAHGPAKYTVRLKLYDNIQKLEEEDQGHHVKITDRGLQLTLTKQECQWWPRLMKSTLKTPWLKIDFERLKNYEDDDEDLSDNNISNGTAKDVIGDYPDLFEKLKIDEFGYKKEELKKVYLVFYNLIQFVMFTYIVTVMVIRFMRDGSDSMAGTYKAVGSVLKFAQILQFLEVMNPLFGYTKGSVFTPLMQVTGRALVLFAMVDAEPRMQTKPVIFYLFAVWSIIEVVRYPYYITELYKFHIYALTWLRYSLWMPLYPFGVLCEGIIVLRNIPYFEETRTFSVAMPNKWNFVFHCPTVMKFYLLFVLVPGAYTLMTRLYAVRRKKICLRRRIKKVK